MNRTRARINSTSPQEINDPFSPISPMSPPFETPQQRYTPYQKTIKRKSGIVGPSYANDQAGIMGNMTQPTEKSFEPPISSNNRSLQSPFHGSNVNNQGRHQSHLRDQVQQNQFQSRQRFHHPRQDHLQTQQPQMYNTRNRIITLYTLNSPKMIGIR